MVIFYWFVWIVGLFICLIIYITYRIEFLDKFYWNLFWIGFFLGLSWELPISLLNVISIYPFVRFITPIPLPEPFSFMVMAITTSFWDAGLFLLGVLFVKLLCKQPYFEKFKVCELTILIIFGQVSELIVELLSTLSNGWEYIVYWWNPRLFIFYGNNITLLPQLIWLIAPIAFYYFTIRLKSGFLAT
ncbi:MAG: hypothetical protein ACFFHD_09150 [Promethearchaeota archaeon]